MKKILILIFLSSALSFLSQDIHFSQFNTTPLLLNPSLTANFDGNQRASLNYKDQWTGFGKGFRTYSFSFESSLLKKIWQKGHLGIGLNAFNDIAGGSQISTTKALLSISSIINISSKQKISAGIQTGIVQNSLNPNNLIWDDQYSNGNYNPSNLSSDQVNFQPFYYGDFAAGISWNYIFDKNLFNREISKVEAGISIHHANRPNIKFSNNGDLLYRKLIAHASSLIGIKSTRLSLNPSFFTAFQGNSKEITAGSLFKYRLKEASHYTGYFSEQTLAIGCHYRFGDALIPSLYYEFGNFLVGISYDFNISDLRAASNYKGGMEVSIRFINPNPFKNNSTSAASFN